MGFLQDTMQFGRDIRKATRNLAQGSPRPIETTETVGAISSGGVENLPDLEKDPATAGRYTYDAIFLTNNSSVTIEVVWSTGSHTVYAGQPFNLELPSGTTQVSIRASGGAVSADEIAYIPKYGKVGGR